MNLQKYPASGRGGGDFGWLTTRYSFSFANWYEPARMGFGSLRVLNDDVVAPASGFATHEHENMEIVTIVTEGAVTHTDSMGNHYELGAGEVQVMSAGTGIAHSEYNNSEDTPLKLFQLWILPRTQNTEPSYAQKRFPVSKNEPQLIVSPEGQSGSLNIGQDAYISRLSLDAGRDCTYTMHTPTHGIYMFVITGTVSVENENLNERDALEITGVYTVHITAKEDSGVLIIEVPMG